ncbi:MAG: competence protein competence protein ComFC [Candidatus Taylorbacteria bacterium]|nr:competence protein competence protein ComFC [Candidatus Taylorbacteria bacterium]
MFSRTHLKINQNKRTKSFEYPKPKISAKNEVSSVNVTPLHLPPHPPFFSSKFLVLYYSFILRWVLNFFKKILSFPQKAFLFAFTDTDTKLRELNQLPLASWGTLAHPILHSENTLSIFNYDNKIIRGALFYIKNKKNEETLAQMCQIAVDILLEDLSEREMLENFRDPIIVSIPSSKEHILKRGYNPSDIIASKISELGNIPYFKNLLYKSKNTPAQKTLSRYERLKNVRNTMAMKPKDQNKIKERCIIVVDDIMTTGGTLKEAKRVLLKAGARKVIGLALAH